ncbi:restriction endonuclease subunit S [Shewanella putrefaciens]|nr:restriction endonuclease subunit S [Shewanella putrefaciens]
MSRFEPTTLGEFCSVNSGFAFKSEQFSEDSNDTFLVKGSNLGHRVIRWDEGPWWDNSDYEKLQRYQLIADDVVLAMDRPIVGGQLKFAWVKSTDPKSLLVQRVACLRAKEVSDQVFLRYVIASPAFLQYIDTITTGVNVPHISGPDIRKYKFNLPIQDERQKIAAVLSAYDDLIENNLERIKLLEEMAQITYEEWFVRLKFPGHEEVEVDSETGLPIGWIKASCYDYMDVLSGGTPKTNIEEYWNGDIKFFTPKDAQTGFFTGNTEKTITSIGLKKCNSKLYDIGTIFITARGTVGKLNLAHEPMAMNQSCYALRGKEGVPQYFLFCALSKAIDAFKGAANGGVFDAIVVDTFKFLSFVRPEVSLVKKFDQMVSPMFDSIYNLLEQNKRLQEARDILLPRLMTGMIDIEQVALPEALLERINNENDNN